MLRLSIPCSIFYSAASGDGPDRQYPETYYLRSAIGTMAGACQFIEEYIQTDHKKPLPEEAAFYE